MDLPAVVLCCQTGRLAKLFKSPFPARPFVRSPEVEWGKGLQTYASHPIPLLTPCRKRVEWSQSTLSIDTRLLPQNKARCSHEIKRGYTEVLAKPTKYSISPTTSNNHCMALMQGFFSLCHSIYWKTLSFHSTPNG